MTFRPMNNTDAVDFLNLSIYVNEISNGIFWIVMLAVIWIVLFFSGLGVGKSASRGWTLASFICSIIGTMMAVLNLINSKFVYLLVLMIGFGLIWMRFEDAPSY